MPLSRNILRHLRQKQYAIQPRLRREKSRGDELRQLSKPFVSLRKTLRWMVTIMKLLNPFAVLLSLCFGCVSATFNASAKTNVVVYYVRVPQCLTRRPPELTLLSGTRTEPTRSPPLLPTSQHRRDSAVLHPPVTSTSRRLSRHELRQPMWRCTISRPRV